MNPTIEEEKSYGLETESDNIPPVRKPDAKRLNMWGNLVQHEFFAQNDYALGSLPHLDKKEVMDVGKGPPCPTEQAVVNGVKKVVKPKHKKQSFEEIWNKCDTDGNGSLDIQEARRMLKQILISSGYGDLFNPEAFDAIFDIFDDDGSGTIDKDEMNVLVEKLVGDQLEGDCYQEEEEEESPVEVV